MNGLNRKSVFVGLVSGVAVTAFAAILMGQGASQPVKSEAQYFVTADGDEAHLWVREGTAIRVVGHGACKECAAKGHDHKDGDHKEGDGHDHGKETPKK
ncbi:MAG: hypothetical protein KF699_10155 [Phycisphaeraceae bacterium]|nr:hypothetical protein [Phycisphaeraceae bacterium]